MHVCLCVLDCTGQCNWEWKSSRRGVVNKTLGDAADVPITVAGKGSTLAILVNGLLTTRT